MKVLVLSFVLLLFTNPCFADFPIQLQSLSSPTPLQCIKDQVAQRGCCSHHGGVCGCSGGSDKCYDGATSPSCDCHGLDDTQHIKFDQTERPKS